MRNRLLSLTRNSIPYVKELRSIAGSVTAVILWQQLDYWFEKYPDGFFKFMSPPEHEHPAIKRVIVGVKSWGLVRKNSEMPLTKSAYGIAQKPCLIKPKRSFLKPKKNTFLPLIRTN